MTVPFEEDVDEKEPDRRHRAGGRRSTDHDKQADRFATIATGVVLYGVVGAVALLVTAGLVRLTQFLF